MFCAVQVFMELCCTHVVYFCLSSLLRTLNSCGDSSIRVGQCFLEKVHNVQMCMHFCNKRDVYINYMMNSEQGMAVVRLYRSCIQIRLTLVIPNTKKFTA